MARTTAKEAARLAKEKRERIAAAAKRDAAAAQRAAKNAAAAKAKKKADAAAKAAADAAAAKKAASKTKKKADAPIPLLTTYNDRVVNAIKSGTQSTTDVNANPIKPFGPGITNGISDITGEPFDNSGINFDEPPEIILTEDGKGPGGNDSSGLTGEQKDAYALLKEIFVEYGLEELVPVIEGYMKDAVGPNQAKLLLRKEPAYEARFKGNELRVNAGLNALSEDAYLALENDYSATLSAYGLKDYFGTVVDAASRKNRNAEMAKVIGLNLSPLEFKDRIDTAVVRVKNTDAATKNAFMAFYNVNDNDLVKYFLSGEDGSVLQKKVQAAEISGARYNAGLGQSTLANATDLATLGVDKVAAVAGYRNIAEVLPESEKLSQIYKSMGIDYNVTTGEEEFLKKTASSKRARQKLVGREVAEFSGSSGAAQGAFSTGYLKKSSSAGAY